MNGYERITAALRGERPDRVPVMLHNFMMAAREAGVTMKAFREDPRRMADVFIRAVETYGYDGVLVDLDTATLAGALGVPVELPEDEPALCHGARLASLAEVDDLEPPDVARDPRVAVWLEAVRLLVRHFGREVYVRGNCDQAPFSLASMMRGAADWMMDLMDEGNRERAERLLDHCAEAGAAVRPADGGHRRAHGVERRQPGGPGPRLAADLPRVRAPLGEARWPTRPTGSASRTRSTSAAAPTASSTTCWRPARTRWSSTTRPTRVSPTTG